MAGVNIKKIRRNQISSCGISGLRIILPRLPDLQVNQLGMSRNTQEDSALKVVPCRAFQTTSFGVATKVKQDKTRSHRVTQRNGLKLFNYLYYCIYYGCKMVPPGWLEHPAKGLGIFFLAFWGGWDRLLKRWYEEIFRNKQNRSVTKRDKKLTTFWQL